MAKGKIQKNQIQTITVGAVLTAFVVVLQFLSNITGALLPTPITLVLVPVVIGASLYGPKMSTWLGLVFAVIVLLSGAANYFLAFSVPGTIITVLAKGLACGFITGIVYKSIEKHNSKLAILLSAIVCPVVNTAIFILGCYIFFIPDLTAEIAKNGLTYANATAYIFLGFAGVNFLIELALNIIINPVIKTVLKNFKQ